MIRMIGLMTACGLSLLWSSAPAGEKAKPFEHTAGEIKIFELTNAERKKKDLAGLVLNSELSKVARAHAANMARQMKFEHMLDGKSPFDRLRAAGYKYEVAGENIAFGEDDPSLEMIMKSWMESKDHRANILQTEYTELGIGIATNKKGEIYFTQMFGRPFKK